MMAGPPMVTTDNGANVRPGGGALSPQQVRGYAYAAGFRGAALDTAVRVAGAESSYIPSNRYAPGPQEDSRGLWQINVVPSANPQYARANLYDPLTNAKIAYAMSKGGTDWGPWTTYTSGKYLSQPTGGAGAGAPISTPAGRGKVSAPAAIAQGKSGITNPTTGSSGQPDFAAAGLAALEAGANKPIDTSGKVTVDNTLSRLLSNISSGLYNSTAPSKAPTSAVPGAPAAKTIAQGKSAPAPALTTGHYVNPIRGAVMGRTDMGLDARGLPNGHAISAIGNSKVIGISPNWYAGQPYVLFQLLDGPDKGKYYYIAEAINPTVHAGQVVRAGQTVGTYNSGGTGLELGWGTSTPGLTLAKATTNYSEGQVTPAGVSFKNFLGALK